MYSWQSCEEYILESTLFTANSDLLDDISTDTTILGNVTNNNYDPVLQNILPEPDEFKPPSLGSLPSIHQSYTSLPEDGSKSKELDVAKSFIQEFKPFSPIGPPSRYFTPGIANFDIEMASSDVNKKKFLYSSKLRRIYVDREANFYVSFNWDEKNVKPVMYVRATVVFSDIEQSEKRVERCVQHFHEASGLTPEVAKNVLQSSRDIGTEGVYYCGDVNRPDSWLSVLVQFNKNTAQSCTHAYKFACKSSCVSGINRRSIGIIFTLEDELGKVYGRVMVGVKVCACLSRDMRRDESSLGTAEKRSAPPANKIRQSKKIKIETQDMKCNMVMLPQISVEKSAMVSGLRCMVDNMVNVINHAPAHAEGFSKSIAQLKEAIKNLEAKPPNAN